MHKRIEGGISGPRAHSALSHRTLARAWRFLRSGLWIGETSAVFSSPNGIPQPCPIRRITSTRHEAALYPANGADYSGAGEGDNYGSYMSAVSNYLRDNRMGSCYWPMFRTGDSWSLTTLSGTGTTQSLSATNASGLARVKSAFNM